MSVDRAGEAGGPLRLLFLTCHLPFPPISGGRRREAELLSRLVEDLDVTICAVSKTPLEDRATARQWKDGKAVVFPAVPANGDGRHQPAQVARHQSRDAADWLRKALASGQYDLLHVEGFYVTHLLPRVVPVPFVLGTQNIEYELWRQRAEVAHDDVRRRSHLLEHERTRPFERAAWRGADLRVAVTADDAEVIRAATPGRETVVVPDGVDLALDLRATVATEHRSDVLYVGNFGYEPNVDAASTLVREVMPKVWARQRDARVLLVGNAPPAVLCEMAARDPRVVVTGRVPEIQPFLEAATVVAYPLRVGGGIKVKVLEAMAAGRPIVTTSVGAQGLGDARRAGAFVVEDQPERFADEVVRLLGDPGARHDLSVAATAAADRLPTWDDAARMLRDAYSLALAETRVERAGTDALV